MSLVLVQLPEKQIFNFNKTYIVNNMETIFPYITLSSGG